MLKEKSQVSEIETNLKMSMKMQRIQLSTTWKRILGVLAIGLACFLTGAECKRSACWRYGHVCWGGHGKRSGQTPLTPPYGSSEAGDGSDLYPRPWNTVEKNRPWKLYPKQSIPHSFYINRQSIVREPLAFMDNSNGKGQSYSQMFLMQHQLNKQPHLLTRVLSPAMFEQNERRMNRDIQIQSDGRSALDDDDSSTKVSSSGENFPVPHASISEVLKRSAIEEGVGNSNNGGGTEEPLEMSSNGLDSGSVATFFRDRKSLGKITTANNSGRERFSNFHDGNNEYMIDLPRQHSNTVFDLTPLSQYRSQRNSYPKIPKTKFHY